MIRLIAFLRVKWLEMEVERCRHSAECLPVMERELAHARIKAGDLLPLNMRHQWRS